MELTQEKIDKLIKRRDSLLIRRDGLYDHAVVDRIDAQLAQVPIGERADVDYALGRVLPKSAAHDTRNIQHTHQCGWCGEWYIGARVDHGCPAPDETQQSATRWSTDEQRAEWKDNGAEKTAQAAQATQDEWLMYIADQHDDMMDFMQLCGNLAL